MSDSTAPDDPSGESRPVDGYFGAEEAHPRREIDPRVWPFIDRYLADNPGGRERLVPLLHRIQERLGHLPYPVQEYVAEKIGLSPVQVYGVVSFYRRFTTTPRARHQVKVCRGTACFIARAQPVLEALQDACGVEPGGISESERLNLGTVRCIGACGMAPAIVVDDEVHGHATPAQAREIVRSLHDRSDEEAGSDDDPPEGVE